MSIWRYVLIFLAIVVVSGLAWISFGDIILSDHKPLSQVTTKPQPASSNNAPSEVTVPPLPLGVTQAQIIDLWGKPERVYRTAKRNGETLDQWIYPDGRYVYVTNGKVVSASEKK